MGGRKTAPSIPTYRAVLRFESDPNASRGLWDVTVEFIKPPKANAKTSTVRMAFLSKDAPQRLLRVGSKFALTEGSRVVAQGEVVGDRA
jgi:hypothetical protein